MSAYQMSEAEERAAGEALVRILGLKAHKRFDSKDKRYQLGEDYLEKTALGVYRVLREAFNQLEATGKVGATSCHSIQQDGLRGTWTVSEEAKQ